MACTLPLTWLGGAGFKNFRNVFAEGGGAEIIILAEAVKLTGRGGGSCSFEVQIKIA